MKSFLRYFLIGALLFVSSLSLKQGFERTVYAIDHIRNANEEMRSFVSVYDEVLKNYVDIEEATPTTLMQGAIYGMLQTLDPYSQFFPPAEYKKFTEQTQGEFGGLGIRINIAGANARWLPGWLTVVEPIVGTPATRCKGKETADGKIVEDGKEYVGLQPDDKIVKIGEESTRGMSLEAAVDQLKGTPGTFVTVQIARKPVEGDPIIIEFEIERDKISVPPIEPDDIKMVADDIGYIWLKDFTSHAHEAVRDAINQLKGKGMKALVFDLRDNTGGLLPVAIDICEMFVERGQTVVSVESRDKSESESYESRRPPLTDVPMIILVNQHSASASEIVAGCIQDHQRGLIIGPAPGVNTYGKGSVQTVLKLEDGSGLKLTTAYYFTPKRQKIHNHGIEPDACSDMSAEEWFQLKMADKVAELKPGMVRGQLEEKKKKTDITVSELLGSGGEETSTKDLYDKQLFLAMQMLRIKLDESAPKEVAETATAAAQQN
ncbi:MAG: S41 family peptidase [Candidatus Omnitrophica bacterium]|nr:S41 family peptidase [Candidatus Omnitrophota bacterium]